MSALKMAVVLIRSSPSLTVTNLCLSQMKRSACISATCLAAFNQRRFLSTQDVTKNIQYISNNKVDISHDPKTLRLNTPMDKPLCIMLNWMLAKQKHVHKYAAIYLEQGFDVLSIACSPWQLLWPMKGTQLVAADILRFISANESFYPMIIHGFSVGGYMWGEVIMHVLKDKQKYQPALDRVVAQIWDSAADITEIPVGVPKAVFPHNAIMQTALRKYMLYHMEKFHEAATIHYMRSSQCFHTNICRAPALFLLSKTDPVGAENSNRKVHDSWGSMGMKTTWICFDKSGHVQHYSKHRKEYMEALEEHLGSVGLISQPEKLRLRM